MTPMTLSFVGWLNACLNSAHVRPMSYCAKYWPEPIWPPGSSGTPHSIRRLLSIWEAMAVTITMAASHDRPSQPCRALGGEVSGAQVLAPGPGHRKRDRSLSVTFSATSPDGFLAFSHSGDDWRDCRDHVRDRLGLPRDGWKERPHRPAPRPRNDTASDWGPPNLDAPPKPETRVTNTPEAERDKARWLWRQHRPIVGSIAERYLRIARGYGAVIQPTLGFLPSRGDHPPAMIAAFGLADEPEAGVLEIPDDAVKAVQLVKLQP